MGVEIKIPDLGESISEVQIGEWLVKEGDSVSKDQALVSIESEKATVEISAPDAGKLGKILKPNGEAAKVGDVVGQLELNRENTPETESTDPKKVVSKSEEKLAAETKSKTTGQKKVEPSPPPAPKQRQMTERDMEAAVAPSQSEVRGIEEEQKAIPTPQPSRASGDVSLTDHLFAKGRSPVPQVEEPPPSEEIKKPSTKTSGDREDETKPMTLLRRTVAKRLVEAQQSMAILTTFNEVDMSAVVALRKKHQESFQAKYGVKIGFMSFFVKAVIESLKLVPQLNAEIRGDTMVFHRYFDIGVAIGAGKGLVVPPLRNAERMSFAEIEKAISDLATRAQANQLKPDELAGGTFTISNGGVYGSMLSTPIINPPQSGILGLHAIQDRPVARDGQVVVRPMMFVALSYDHRIVDGREAVTFLKRVKEIIEDPARLLIEV